MAVRICSNLPLSLTGSLIHHDFISVSSCFGERKQITIYYEINRPLEQILQVYDHSEKFQSNRLAPIEGYYDVNVTAWAVKTLPKKCFFVERTVYQVSPADPLLRRCRVRVRDGHMPS